MIYFTLSLLVPASSPDMIGTNNISSRAIQVFWDEVPAIDQNGLITMYEVEFNQTTFHNVSMSDSVIVQSSLLMAELTELEEYVEYSIRVRAYTRVGAGPYSDVVNVTTSQDGKYFGATD